jgi:SAM-dependent methyltransferase
MEFLELKNISERFMELVNPTSLEKVLTIGRVAGLRPGSRVLDLGCGFGEPLVRWAEAFGISAVGIDVREHACARARRKVAEHGLVERIQIACGDAATYPFEPGAYDVAACLGATFIWSGFGPAIRRMSEAIRPGGKLIVGEPYWRRGQVPPEFARAEQGILTEWELLQSARAAGFDFEYALHSSQDEWDRYEADNWRGLVHWIEESPDHPERQQVIDHLHASQDEYIRYGREHYGFALYLLNPVQQR